MDRGLVIIPAGMRGQSHVWPGEAEAGEMIQLSGEENGCLGNKTGGLTFSVMAVFSFSH